MPMTLETIIFELGHTKLFKMKISQAKPRHIFGRYDLWKPQNLKNKNDCWERRVHGIFYNFCKSWIWDPDPQKNTASNTDMFDFS